MKVLILSPYLDAPFGTGKGVQRTGEITPLREHWRNFLLQLELYHDREGDEVDVWEDYMWNFDNPDDLGERLEFDRSDRVYVPHRNHKQYKHHTDKVVYYMQTVFPHLFTVDSMGWGGTNSLYPFEYINGQYSPVYDEYVERIESNVSKFDQEDQPWTPPNFVPNDNIHLYDDYIFFPCQLPHDETIKYHSDFGVVETLHTICDWADQNGVKVVAKGHPINPASMLPLKEITLKFTNCEWVENVSVHTLMKYCKAVYTVNSGTGMEALLHKKPLVVFGRAEYDVVAYRCDGNNLDQVWEKVLTTNQPIMEQKYRHFIDGFVNYCVDSRKPINHISV